MQVVWCAALGILFVLGAHQAHGQASTPEQMMSAMKQYRSDLHRAVSRNWIAPPGLSADAVCRFTIVQRGGGGVEAVEFEQCHSKAFEQSIRDAVARTSLPPPPQFPQDRPVVRTSTVLEFRPQDLR